MFDNGSVIRAHGGGNVRNGRVTHTRKIRRQERAKARLEVYEALTTQQKLSGLIPGGSNKQRAKLMAKLAAENLAVVAKATKAK